MKKGNVKMNITIPAIRAKIGDWIYYASTLSFKQVAEYVRRVDDELHKSNMLRDMLQRSITDNCIKISDYIEKQKEMFFNSLVLAVYDGEPQWQEIALDYGDGEESYDIGFLELNGDVKIFPVDGQHRVEGIKKVIADSDKYDEERIPVIFIGHKKDDEGMQRARRMFSTLNRYAKPVSPRDIIALDEDDCVAIASRNLIESHTLFKDERILDALGKAIPETNNTAFTSIITFYECNYELLGLFLKDIVVMGTDGNKPLKGRPKSVEFIRFRPDDEKLEKFKLLCTAFWNSLTSHIDDVKQYVSNKADSAPYRNKNGGNLLFRPVALKPFVKAVLLIKKKTEQDFDAIAIKMNEINLYIDSPEWGGVLWDRQNKTMLMNNHTAVELLLVYYFDRALLSSKEQKRLSSAYARALQITPQEAAIRLQILE